LSYRIFSATVSASPMSSAPVGPRTASNCARVVGGQPRRGGGFAARDSCLRNS
jgi:hypothetical protein